MAVSSLIVHAFNNSDDYPRDHRAPSKPRRFDVQARLSRAPTATNLPFRSMQFTFSRTFVATGESGSQVGGLYVYARA